MLFVEAVFKKTRGRWAFPEKYLVGKEGRQTKIERI